MWIACDNVSDVLTFCPLLEFDRSIFLSTWTRYFTYHAHGLPLQTSILITNGLSVILLNDPAIALTTGVQTLAKSVLPQETNVASKPEMRIGSLVTFCVGPRAYPCFRHVEPFRRLVESITSTSA